MAGCLALDYPRVEVVVVSDEAVALPAEAKSVRTGADHDTGPGEKRDVGMHAAAVSYPGFLEDLGRLR